MTSRVDDEQRVADSPAGVAATDPPVTDGEWDEVFGAEYGRRLWNVGCG